MAHNQNKPSKFYLSNCIIRILRSPCSPNKEGERASDLAEAVLIASREGEWIAHSYLIQLCEEAEAGKYFEMSEPASQAPGDRKAIRDGDHRPELARFLIPCSCGRSDLGINCLCFRCGGIKK